MGPGRSPGGIQGAKPPEALKRLIAMYSTQKGPKYHNHGSNSFKFENRIKSCVMACY